MNKIILPLDGLSYSEVMKMANDTKDLVWGFKINDQLIARGVSIVEELSKYGNVMADPKLYDIPNTIDNSLKRLIKAGANIVTVHCSADYSPPDSYKKYLAGVTILTSMKQKSIEKYYRLNIPTTVLFMANEASQKGFSYVVCSPQEVGCLADLPIKRICPGIRPKWYQEEDDQERTTTPKEAIIAGADLLVIGRPLLKARNITDAIKRTNDEIE